MTQTFTKVGIESGYKMQKLDNITKKIGGFTLIEVLVAITILLLVILPLASLYAKSLGVIQNAALYSQAIQLAQERMEVCESLDYVNLEYHNMIFAPGFPFSEGFPLPGYDRDILGNPMVALVGAAYDNRDIPDTDDVEWEFDPTDSNGENYPVPVYRDYYNNYTGRCLDPNFNGLCDDDLDNDGLSGILADPVDMDDIEIATNGTLRRYDSEPIYSASPAAALDTWIPGDGLFDTVVEGMYVSSMDTMYRRFRVQESLSPILDIMLLQDNAHNSAVSGRDYRHRDKTYKNFVRMTTIIDPTPQLPNPMDVNTWVDFYYIWDKQTNDPGNYTAEVIQKLRICLQRDLPLTGGLNTYELGVLDETLVTSNARIPGPFTVNYTPPLYGKKVIVNVFYLTGKGEVELVDLDNDGVFEEQVMETYGGARRVRLERVFYNDQLLNGFVKILPPPRWFYQDTSGPANNPSRSVTITDSGDDLDPCSFDNYGLPYLIAP